MFIKQRSPYQWRLLMGHHLKIPVTTFSCQQTAVSCSALSSSREDLSASLGKAAPPAQVAGLRRMMGRLLRVLIPSLNFISTTRCGFTMKLITLKPAELPAPAARAARRSGPAAPRQPLARPGRSSPGAQLGPVGAAAEGAEPRCDGWGAPCCACCWRRRSPRPPRQPRQ